MKPWYWLTLLGLAACGNNPEDIFSFEGRLEDEQGRALVGHPVQFRWSPGLELASNGCSLPPESTIDTTKVLGSVKSDDAGVWYREFFRAQFDYQQAASCLRFETTLGQTQALIDVPLYQGETNEFATLRPWVDQTRLTPVDGGTQVDLQLPPFEVPPSLVITELLAGDGGVSWASVLGLEPDAGSSMNFVTPIEALENESARLRLSVVMNDQLFESGVPGPRRRATSTYLLARETGLTFAAGPVPVSRGASCGTQPLPCPFTDGAMTPVTVSDNTLTFTFTRPVLPRLIAIRASDTGGQFLFLTSPDHVDPGPPPQLLPIQLLRRNVSSTVGARAGSGTLDFGLYDIDVQSAPVKASKQWGLTGLSGAVGEVSFYE